MARYTRMRGIPTQKVTIVKLSYDSYYVSKKTKYLAALRSTVSVTLTRNSVRLQYS